MSLIKNIHGRQILDSRGNPTIEVDVILENNILGRASVPSGASTGVFEAVEKRDGDPSKYLGKGTLKAIDNVNNEINSELKGKDSLNQKNIDNLLINLDGSSDKSRLGANAILGTSLAISRAASNFKNIPLYKYLGEDETFTLPTPMMNIVNGGSHANNNLDVQEIMIIPVGAESFSEALRWGSEIFQHLKQILNENGLSTAVGDEGGFSPQISNLSEAISFICKAIERANRYVGQDVFLSLDIAASELYKDGYYFLEGLNKKFGQEEFLNYWIDIAKTYPIISIEDPFEENDFNSFSLLKKELGSDVQIVGDDLFATNIQRLQKGINLDSGNAILIKLNQIGTLSETIETIKLAKKSNFGVIVSHRSGETEDNYISDLSVALNAGQIKTGSLSRSDRTSKYNQLLRIEESLKNKAIFFGKNIIKNA